MAILINGMELKDFVKETMLAIAKGDNEASIELSQMGWTTNVKVLAGKIDGMPSCTTGGLGKSVTSPIVGVGFRVQGEVEEASTMGGGASIRVLSAKGNFSNARTETHEVSFVLPMTRMVDKSK